MYYNLALMFNNVREVFSHGIFNLNKHNDMKGIKQKSNKYYNS